MPHCRIVLTNEVVSWVISALIFFKSRTDGALGNVDEIFFVKEQKISQKSEP